MQIGLGTWVCVTNTVVWLNLCRNCVAGRYAGPSTIGESEKGVGNKFPKVQDVYNAGRARSGGRESARKDRYIETKLLCKLCITRPRREIRIVEGRHNGARWGPSAKLPMTRRRKKIIMGGTVGGQVADCRCLVMMKMRLFGRLLLMMSFLHWVQSIFEA